MTARGPGGEAPAADPFASLASPAPSVSTPHAERLVATLYGKTVRADPLPSERDRNFHCVDDEAYVLRIANPHEDLLAVDLQVQVLRHLAQVAPTLPVPRVVPTQAGDLLAEVSVADEEACVLHMLTYLPGRPLRAVRSESQAAALGGTLAAIDRALRGFFHPAANRPLGWDVRRLEGALRLVDESSTRRDQTIESERLRSEADRIVREILPALPGLRAQVVHGDLNPSNVLVADDASGRITGIVDFGDVIHAPLVCEVAVGAAYLLDGDPAGIDRVNMFLAGYEAVTVLEPEERELLTDLVLGRLIMMVALSEWRARRFPERRDHILKSTARAWGALAQLCGPARRALEERLYPRWRLRPARPTAASPTTLTLPDEELASRRRRVLGPGYRLFYQRPLHLIRGRGVWLFDTEGRAYLDVYNNVAQVGHCHPKVVEAVALQTATLNTHTRYLHAAPIEYAERLVATLPAPLARVVLTCSGSEANELALRMARSVTGRRGVIATQHAYHGNTALLAALSANYYPTAEPPPAFVQTVPVSELFGPASRRPPADAETAFLAALERAIAVLEADGHGVAAFIVDPHLTSDGMVSMPPGCLRRAAARVRAAGGVFIADEVQAGLGRLGDTFWSFTGHELVPDIVTMGKSLGNGYPVGAVVASESISDEFVRGTRYFNTYGGNPVACAAGLAVLDVMAAEDLQRRARTVGAALAAGLRSLAFQHPIIADVRGRGLFPAVELADGPDGKRQAPEATARTVNWLRDAGALTSSIGPRANVLKLRPPLVFAEEHVERFLSLLDEALTNASSADRGPSP